MKENFYTPKKSFLARAVSSHRFSWQLLSFALMFFFIQLGTKSSAQDYLILGSQEIGLSTYEPGPVNAYWESRRMQMIYTASELASVGAGPGEIEKLAWDVTGVIWSGVLPGYTISMGHTTNTAFSGSFVSGLQVVKSAFSYAPEIGFHDIDLDTPFDWDGTSNLVIEVCFGISTMDFSQDNFGSSWSYNSIANCFIGYETDGANLCGQAGSPEMDSKKPRVRLFMATQDCIPPANLTAAITSSTTAEIGWSAPSSNPESYDIYISTDNTIPDESTIPTEEGYMDISYSLDNLPEGSTYFFIRSHCGDQYSSWIFVEVYLGYCAVTSTNTNYGISNFTTTGGYTNINNTSGAGAYSDYTVQTASASAGGSVNFTIQGYNNGTYGMGLWIDWNHDYDFSDPGEQIYVSGSYVGSANGTINVPADAANGSYRMRVVANWLSTSPIPCGDLGSVSYGEAEDYTFMVSDPPACPPVTSVSAAVDGTSVTLTWVESSTPSDGYEYIISQSNTLPTENGTAITGTTLTVDDIEPNHTYYAFVRANCGDDGYSFWVSTSFWVGYCVPSSMYTGDYLSAVSSSGAVVNVSYTATSTPAGGYSNQTAQPFNSFGGQVITINTTYVGGANGVNIWVDWNQNLNFDDDELVATQQNGNASKTLTFTVPEGTTNGEYRVRVRGQWNALPPACGQVNYGSTIDFNLTVADAPDCVPVLSLNSSVNGTSVTLTWTEESSPIGGYEYVISQSSDLPTENGTSVTGTTVTVDDLEPNHTYYAFVRANCEDNGYSYWASTSFWIGYCQPTSGTTSYGITNVTTTGGFTNINNSSGPSTYSDYTDQAVSSYSGGSVDYSITVASTQGIAIWIDWNNNMDFSDPGEMIYSSGSYLSSTSGTITVPGGITNGDYRMRIVGNFLATTPTPCDNLGSAGYGEAEDYTFTVMDPPNCAPLFGLMATAVEGGESIISWNASPSAAAEGYGWIVVANGGSPDDTAIASGTTDSDVTSATATGLTDFTAYTVYVRTLCNDENSIWVMYNIPAPCTTSINGQYPSGVYQPLCNGTLNTVTTCAYASEFAVIQVDEGVTYTFSVSVATDIVTISSTDGNTVYAAGTGSVVWTASFSGLVNFYSHIVNCGSQSACRVKTIQCGEPWENEANVRILYTLGGLPLTYGDNHVIQASITNPAEDTWTKEVTLQIEGANTFTDVYELTLSGGETQTISFAPFTATNTGMQTVTISVEDDFINSNNTYTVNQLVTNDLFSHKEPGAEISGAVGIGGGYTGNFVAKFTTAVPADINEIKVDFSGDAGVSYQYRIFDANGPGGLPGTVLFDSPVMSTVLGEAFLPVNPPVTVDGDFYVGLRELGQNFGFSYQDEDPLRPGIFYFNTEDGSYPWTDISTSGAPTARLAIEAQIYSETAPNCALGNQPANGAVVCHMAGTTLSWASGGGAPTGYHLYFGTDEDPEYIDDFTGTSYEIEELVEGQTYYWYVIPYNEFGEAEACNVLSFTAGMGGCYCEPEYSTGVASGDMIAKVEILGTTLSNISGTSTNGPAYTYYTGEPNYTAELQAGTSYTLQVTIGTVGGQGIAVWIDYNDNGIFEPSEKVAYTTASINGGETVAMEIYIDCNAPLGLHRMRIRDVWFQDGITMDPCALYTYGEAEDYDISVIAPPACPTPHGGQLQYVTDISATLIWNAGCNETQWDVYVAQAGSSEPEDEPTYPNVTSPLLVEGLSPFTMYEFWVRAVCDEDETSDWAGPYSFSTLLMPPPENDNPCGAITLTVSQDCEYVTGTNEDASDTPGVPEPSCSLYLGSDVWFTVVVPGNGTVNINTQAGTLDDAAMAVYTANACDGIFTEIACNDDANGTLMPALSLNNLTPGETLYIRVFSWGNFDIGTFGICATSPCTAPLSASIDVDVTLNTVTITWPSMGPDATYNWELRNDGAAGSGDDGLVASGTTEAGMNTVTITDLEYLSLYTFYVSVNCSEDETSPWSTGTGVVITALPGCTDPNACNYDPEAGEDDGSCVMEESTWYEDADGDGYGNADVSQVACLAPAGFVANNTDCDDSDASVWQSMNLYIDADGDGYDNGSEDVCYGNTIPDGYSITTLGHDCDDNDSQVFGEVVLVVSLQLPITTVCVNSAAFTLTGGSPAGGTWSSLGAGVSGSSFNPSVAGLGQHTITYTVPGDGICTIGGSASAVITVETCPGVDEEFVSNEITLYPTYTNNHVNINGKDLREVVIMDINGKIISAKALNGDSAVISMNEYSAGIYFVRIATEKKVKTFKVVRVS